MQEVELIFEAHDLDAPLYCHPALWVSCAYYPDFNGCIKDALPVSQTRPAKEPLPVVKVQGPSCPAGTAATRRV